MFYLFLCIIKINNFFFTIIFYGKFFFFSVKTVLKNTKNNSFKSVYNYNNNKMIINENSCWPTIDNLPQSSRLLHSMQQDENLLNGREQINYFNVNTVRLLENTTTNVMPSEQQQDQQASQQQQQPIPRLPISHISSNGYYGYAMVFKNDNEICKNSTNTITIPTSSTNNNNNNSSNDNRIDNIEDQQQQQQHHHQQLFIERRKRQYDNSINNHQRCIKRLRFEHNGNYILY